jgi:hypothetical protein
MQLRFYIDAGTGEPHIYKHRVSESEVEEVLGSAGEDRLGRDGSRIATGRTLSGRLLRVVYVLDVQPDSYFVITGYELQGKAGLAYRRRQRKKQR